MNNETNQAEGAALDPAIELAGQIVDLVSESNFDVVFNALAVATAGLLVDYAAVEYEGEDALQTIDNAALESVKQEYLAGLYKAINFIKQQINSQT